MTVTTPTWQVRAATLDDLDDLVAFNQAMAQETEDRSLPPERLRAGVRTLLQRPDLGHYWMVGEQGANDGAKDGAVAGSLAITFEWSDWRNGVFWWIQSVYVRPQQRRRGAFAALYADIERRARATPDVCGLRLYVEHDNRRAQATYEGLGMVRPHYHMYEVEFVTD